MTAMIDRLVSQLAARGLAVVRGPGPGELLLTGPAAEKTPEVLAAVKAFKPQLLGRAGPPPARREEPRPAGRPLAVYTAPDLTFVRSGVCRARAAGSLCWAGYEAGRLYWFEEYLAPWRDPAVASYHVFAGGAVGLAGASKFAAMFEEVP